MTAAWLWSKREAVMADGLPLYFLDMGWEDEAITVEYDGDDHRERSRWRRDIVRAEYLVHLGRTHIRVAAGERDCDVLRRVARAWERRSRLLAST